MYVNPVRKCCTCKYISTSRCISLFCSGLNQYHMRMYTMGKIAIHRTNMNKRNKPEVIPTLCAPSCVLMSL